jgi:hypothetical protein
VCPCLRCVHKTKNYLKIFTRYLPLHGIGLKVVVKRGSGCIQVNMIFDVSSDFLTNRFSQTTESPGPRIPTHLILSGESKF